MKDTLYKVTHGRVKWGDYFKVIGFGGEEYWFMALKDEVGGTIGKGKLHKSGDVLRSKKLQKRLKKIKHKD